MARQNPGKSVSSDNTCSLPPMPTNPSRVDRLVIDSLREHARVSLTEVSCYCYIFQTALFAVSMGMWTVIFLHKVLQFSTTTTTTTAVL